MESDVLQLCRQLKPVYGPRMDRLWQAYLAEDLDGRRELETSLKLLFARAFGATVDNQPNLLIPPPAAIAAGSYAIGQVLYGDRVVGPFGLREEEFIQHLAIFGRSGSGKTNVALGILRQLLEQGKPFLIFDWKRNYRDLVPTSQAPITVFTVGREIVPFRFNPLIPPPRTDAATHLKKLIEIIASTYYLGEGVMYLLQKAIDSLYRQFGVYRRRPERWPTMRDVLTWVENYRAQGREANWLASTLRAAAVLCFGQIGRVINVDAPQPLEQLLEKNVIMELDALPSSDKTFLIESLLLWIHHYRMTSGRREQFQHVLLIEEAHHILLRKEHTGKESVVDVVLREIRELGEAIILIDQHPSLISLPALGNTYCTITMNLKHRSDVNTAASAMLLESEQQDILGRLPVGHAVVKLQARWFTPFLIRVPLIPIAKGSVDDAQLRRLMQGVSADSAGSTNSAGPTAAIPDAEATLEERGFVADLVGHPLSGVAARYDRLGLSRRKGNQVKQSLLDRGWIRQESVTTASGITVLACLTPRGLAELQRLDPPSARRANLFLAPGLEHEFWRAAIAQACQAQSWEVTREEPVNGHVDLVLTKGEQRIAVEVETGKSDAVANVHKALAQDFVKIIIAATSPAAMQTVHNQLDRAGQLDQPRVHLESAKGLLSRPIGL